MQVRGNFLKIAARIAAIVAASQFSVFPSIHAQESADFPSSVAHLDDESSDARVDPREREVPVRAAALIQPQPLIAPPVEFQPSIGTSSFAPESSGGLFGNRD